MLGFFLSRCPGHWPKMARSPHVRLLRLRILVPSATPNIHSQKCIMAAAKLASPPASLAAKTPFLGATYLLLLFLQPLDCKSSKHDLNCRVLARRRWGHPIVLIIALSLHYLLQPSCILQWQKTCCTKKQVHFVGCLRSITKRQMFGSWQQRFANLPSTTLMLKPLRWSYLHFLLLKLRLL